MSYIRAPAHMLTALLLNHHPVMHVVVMNDTHWPLLLVTNIADQDGVLGFWLWAGPTPLLQPFEE